VYLVASVEPAFVESHRKTLYGSRRICRVDLQDRRVPIMANRFALLRSSSTHEHKLCFSNWCWYIRTLNHLQSCYA
jgi:hypothetical protein